MLIDTTTPPAPDIPLSIDAQTARGTYCNVAIVAHSKWEFVVDFAFVGPGQRGGVIVSRVVLHPSQALALHRALGMNLDQFTNAHGPLETAPGFVPTAGADGP